MKYGLLAFLGLTILLLAGVFPSGCGDMTPRDALAFKYGMLRGHLMSKGDIQGQMYLDAIERQERADDEAQASK